MTYKTIQKLSNSILAITLLLAPFQAIAEGTSGGGMIDVDTSKPFTFTCKVSAYYSPLPDQSRYSTGSYESEKRLNGNGTNGADGTEVYQGMIAAPREFPFGTKINIEGYGVGAVHDRGGAINDNRIDIWMGFGDEGLNRALNWGMRTTTCTTYFPGVDLDAEAQKLEGSFNLPSASGPANSGQTSMKPVGKNLYIGSSGDQVRELQSKLKDVGYYSGEITGEFDELTEEAVKNFQVDMGVIKSTSSYGAGYVGSITWKALNSGKPVADVLLATSNDTVLTIGDAGDAVNELQKKLKEKGFFTYPVITGYYGPATAEAVLAFQKSQGIVNTSADNGAGNFGPVTRTALYENEGRVLAMSDSDDNGILEVGDEGEAISQLQHTLQKLGYFTYDGGVTGYYGEATAEAVYNFQLKSGLVRSKKDLGAGKFGPITRASLDLYISDLLTVNPQIASAYSTPESSDIMVNTISATSYNYYFENDLDYGATGEDVLGLQEKLKSLGYDTPGFYGEVTKEAVFQFQLEHGIVQSRDDQGAGVFGPVTREVMNGTNN